MKMIRRAEFERFSGLEALALARAYQWLEAKTKPEEPPMTVVTEQKTMEIKDNGANQGKGREVHRVQKGQTRSKGRKKG